MSDGIEIVLEGWVTIEESKLLLYYGVGSDGISLVTRTNRVTVDVDGVLVSVSS